MLLIAIIEKIIPKKKSKSLIKNKGREYLQRNYRKDEERKRKTKKRIKKEKTDKETKEKMKHICFSFDQVKTYTAHFGA